MTPRVSSQTLKIQLFTPIFEAKKLDLGENKSKLSVMLQKFEFLYVDEV
jgi:hypothetical protein